MKIKVELLKNYIYNFLENHIEDFVIDEEKIVDTTATRMLAEIQEVICEENYSDFEAVEEIVRIFEKYNVNAGFRHDF